MRDRLKSDLLRLVAAVSAFTIVGSWGTPRPALAATPAVTVGTVGVWESDGRAVTIQVPVDLSEPTSVRASVHYEIHSGTATAGSDFIARSGTAKFGVGSARSFIKVTVLPDTLPESDETVEITLSAPKNVALGIDTGAVVIHDNDAINPPDGVVVSVGDASITEADSGSHVVTIPITLNAAPPSRIDLELNDGCGTITPEDALVLAPSVTFQRGQIVRFLTFTLAADTRAERTKQRTVTLSVTRGNATVANEGRLTLLDDDGDPLPGTSQRVSVASDGSQAVFSDPCTAAGSTVLDTSSDGRFVLMASDAVNLVGGDTNGVTDLFLRDTQTNTTTRVDLTTDEAQLATPVADGSVSDDGRYVAFTSFDSQLVPTGTTDPQVFVRDVVDSVTTLVTTGPSGAVPGGARLEDLSGDGSIVLLRHLLDWSLWQLDLGAPSATQVASSAQSASMSRTGRYVAFVSALTDLVANDDNNYPDVFLRDMQSNTTERVNLTPTGAQEIPNLALGNGSEPTVTDDGRFVSFTSFNSNIGSLYTIGFVRDRALATTISITDDFCWASNIDLAAAGTIVAFTKVCPQYGRPGLVGSSFLGVWTKDLTTGGARELDVNGAGLLCDACRSGRSSLSTNADGTTVAFSSAGTDLVVGDTNERPDVFVAH